MFNSFIEWILLSEGNNEELALNILSNEPNKQEIIKQFKVSGIEPKFFPAMAHFYHSINWNTLKRDFETYSQLVKNKRMEMVQVSKNKVTLEKKDIDYLKFSEIVHGKHDYYTFRNKKTNDAMPEKINEKPFFSNDGIEIYKSENKDACVKYGNGYSFCISNPMGTAWQYYRDTKSSTFYFVFDRKRDVTDPLHVVVVDMSANGPELTDAKNTTGKISVYGTNTNKYLDYLENERGIPKSIFKNIPLSTEEKKDAELFSKRIININEFKKLNASEIARYIARGHELTNAELLFLIEQDYKDLVIKYITTFGMLDKDQIDIILSDPIYSQIYLKSRIKNMKNEALTSYEFFYLSNKQRIEVIKKMELNDVKNMKTLFHSNDIEDYNELEDLIINHRDDFEYIEYDIIIHSLNYLNTIKKILKKKKTLENETILKILTSRYIGFDTKNNILNILPKDNVENFFDNESNIKYILNPIFIDQEMNLIIDHKKYLTKKDIEIIKSSLPKIPSEYKKKEIIKKIIEKKKDLTITNFKSLINSQLNNDSIIELGDLMIEKHPEMEKDIEKIINEKPSK